MQTQRILPAQGVDAVEPRPALLAVCNWLEPAADMLHPSIDSEGCKSCPAAEQGTASTRAAALTPCTTQLCHCDRSLLSGAGGVATAQCAWMLHNRCMSQHCGTTASLLFTCFRSQHWRRTSTRSSHDLMLQLLFLQLRYALLVTLQVSRAPFQRYDVSCIPVASLD